MDENLGRERRGKQIALERVIEFASVMIIPSTPTKVLWLGSSTVKLGDVEWKVKTGHCFGSLVKIAHLSVFLKKVAGMTTPIRIGWFQTQSPREHRLKWYRPIVGLSGAPQIE